MSTEKKSVFEVLSSINVNDKVEKKNGLTYLSWAWAWSEVKKRYPDASYEVVEYYSKDLEASTPYLFDPKLGYLVQTKVTVGDDTIPMQLFVMDGANKPKKDQPYTYKKPSWQNGKKVYVDATVEAADMFDINTTIMRCLTKNLAMHGLGHYIYAGEDVPEQVVDDKAPQAAKPTPATPKANESTPTTPKAESPAKDTKKAPTKKVETPKLDPKAKALDEKGNIKANDAFVEELMDERQAKALAFFKEFDGVNWVKVKAFSKISLKDDPEAAKVAFGCADSKELTTKVSVDNCLLIARALTEAAKKGKEEK